MDHEHTVAATHHDGTLTLTLTLTAARRLAALNRSYTYDAEPIDAHLIAAGLADLTSEGQTRLNPTGAAALRLYTDLTP